MYILTVDKGEDSGMESRGDHRLDVKEISEMSLGESRLSVLAKKGPIQVYVAKYSYDPYQYSPNENPEAELPLHSGDYVLIYGEMDEVRLAGDCLTIKEPITTKNVCFCRLLNRLRSILEKHCRSISDSS